MKTMRPVCWTLLVLLTLTAADCAPATPSGRSEAPSAAELEEVLAGSYTAYTCAPFSCSQDGGHGLRYGFANQGTGPCSVQLYRSTLLGWAAVGSGFTVLPGEEMSQVVQESDGKTFQIKVTSLHGIGAPVQGHLCANQLDG